jgi:translation initiation factor IF-2
VRFIENFLGKRVEKALPSDPVRISGFSKLPPAGTLFSVVTSRKEAEALVSKAQESESAGRSNTAQDGLATLPLIIKTDVAGSVDAILHELAKIRHERAAITVISSGVGSVSEGDVKAASAARGVIVAFHTGIDTAARELAERDGVPIETFTIIYELSTKVTELLAARAPQVTLEQELGRALVLKSFSSASKKQVLGARLKSGTFSLGSLIKVLRKDAEIARGKVTNLQQARVDVKEIRTDGDFGIEIEAKVALQYGDELVTFTLSTT